MHPTETQAAMPRAPTDKQLRYLRALAMQTATTFAPPRTAGEASKAIRELQGRKRSASYERSADRDAIAGRQGANDGAGVTADEIVGYGSNAHWRTSG